jgi:carbamoyl-phosphate synthase small subunit
MFQTETPVFGICLGHQIIGLANGISTYKMFMVIGINHPVMNVLTGGELHRKIMVFCK